MRLEKTDQGFSYGSFKDACGTPCSLQQSSAIDNTEEGFEEGLANPGSSFLWLGKLNGRMHLNRVQVQELVDVMTAWLVTGRLETGTNKEN